ncbi:sensor histidine kinase [Pararhizobium sp.]|uniref:sensor histidine kinase n=1 Tax=Pararhizobium sp. TaxID=1977563 RepID=UPI00271F07C8|nr:ATP-binding protein [Pararhizobium sp.]MDO9418320.1 CHASE3 domain-containing protein [Pararhizobium sp.]
MKQAQVVFLRFVPATLAFGAFVLLAIVLAALYFTGVTREQSERALSSAQLNARVVALFSTLQDAETGQRGFVLTQEEVYLRPYNQANETILTQFAALRPQLTGIGVPEDLLQRLSDLLATKLQELSSTIELVRQDKAGEALAVIRTDQGRQAMGNIRAVIRSIDEQSASYAAAQIAALKHATLLLTITILIGAVLLVVLVGGAMAVVMDHSKELETARKELERANATLEIKVGERTEHLERANRELQNYAYIVSHDLRAPLVNIMGFTEELERASAVFGTYLSNNAAAMDEPSARPVKLAIEEDVPEALRFIRSSIQRMDSLINEILRLARAGSREMRPEAISMRDLIETTTQSLQHRLEQSGARITISRDLPAIVSDRLALQQIFGNLLDNAVKYLDPARPGLIEVEGTVSGTDAEFYVTDNGRGIAGQDMERVFELFRRAGAQDRPGEGIGLAHVRALVRRLGGDVTLSSVLGQGTTFIVKLPADLRFLKRRIGE